MDVEDMEVEEVPDVEVAVEDEDAADANVDAVGEDPAEPEFEGSRSGGGGTSARSSWIASAFVGWSLRIARRSASAVR